MIPSWLQPWQKKWEGFCEEQICGFWWKWLLGLNLAGYNLKVGLGKMFNLGWSWHFNPILYVFWGKSLKHFLFWQLVVFLFAVFGAKFHVQISRHCLLWGSRSRGVLNLLPFSLSLSVISTTLYGQFWQSCDFCCIFARVRRGYSFWFSSDQPLEADEPFTTSHWTERVPGTTQKQSILGPKLNKEPPSGIAFSVKYVLLFTCTSYDQEAGWL